MGIPQLLLDRIVKRAVEVMKDELLAAKAIPEAVNIISRKR